MFCEKGLFCTAAETWGRVELRKTRPRCPKCVRSGFVHWASRRWRLDGGDFAHWRPCLGGGLYTGDGRYCANPIPNNPPSAQSPGRRLRALYKPPPEQALQCAKSGCVRRYLVLAN